MELEGCTAKLNKWHCVAESLTIVSARMIIFPRFSMIVNIEELETTSGESKITLAYQPAHDWIYSGVGKTQIQPETRAH